MVTCMNICIQRVEKFIEPCIQVDLKILLHSGLIIWSIKRAVFFLNLITWLLFSVCKPFFWADVAGFLFASVPRTIQVVPCK